MTSVPALSDPRSPSTENVYNRVFWLAYAANFTMVAAHALTFRFAELIAYLGGTELDTGEIIQVGMIGALACRLFLGRLLDRYGTRLIWLWSAFLFAVSSVGFVVCRDISWTIFVARIAFAVGVAGMSTAAIVHIQYQAPRHRRTEIIGNFGSSGFIGMVVGSQLGDVIFRVMSDGPTRFYVLFGLTAVLGLAYMVLVLFATRGQVHQRPTETPGALRLLVRYWPGTVVLVAMMMGVSLTVTTVFLTRMTTGRGLGGIGTFFLGYAISAFVFRVASSRWEARIGTTGLLLLGLTGHATAHLLLAWATTPWHLVLPAVIGGFGHALLFPSVVSIGAGAFPHEYRGTGTSLVLGFTEVGVAISAPVLGWIIDTCRAAGMADPFAPMFYTSAGFAVAVGLIYALSSIRSHRSEPITQLVAADAEVVGGRTDNAPSPVGDRHIRC